MLSLKLSFSMLALCLLILSEIGCLLFAHGFECFRGYGRVEEHGDVFHFTRGAHE